MSFNGDRWLSSGELADVWKVSSKTVTRYAVSKGLPFDETPGGHRRYLLSRAEAWRASLAPHRERMRAGAGQRLNDRRRRDVGDDT